MSARSPIVMRDAEREDAGALVALWAECAGASQDEGSEAFTQQALWREPGVAEAAAALELNLSQPASGWSLPSSTVRSSARQCSPSAP